MTKKWSIVLQVVIVIAALAGSVYVAFTPANSLMNWYTTDDAFFYYKVARNFLAGNGFSFDGINLSNGFHPLWMLICLGVFWLAHFDLILPLRVLVIVSGLFNAATALVLFRLLVKHIHPGAAAVGAFAWGLLPSIYSTTTVHGMETAVSAFFLALLVSQASAILTHPDKITTRQMLLVGLVGVLTIFARLDNVFIVAAIGFFLMFKVTRVSRLLMYDLMIIGVAMIGSWMLRFGLEEIRVNSYSIYPTLGLAILIKPVCYYFCGLYEGFGEHNRWQKLLRQVIAAAASFIVMFVFMFAMNKLGVLHMFSRSLLAIDAALCSFLIFCSRLLRKQTGEPSVAPFMKFVNWFKQAWKTTLMRGVWFAVPIAALMGAYITFNKVIFGTYAPVSGRIKIWWSTLPNTPYAQQASLLSLLGLSPKNSDSPWALVTSKIDDVASALLGSSKNQPATLHTVIFLILFLLVAFGVFAILNSHSSAAGRKAFRLLLPALFLGCLLQVAYYNTVGYQAIRSWYWISQMMTIVLLFAVLFDPFFTWLEGYKPSKVWSIVIAFLLIATITARHVNSLLASFPATVAAGEEEAYLVEVNEVERLTEPGSKIGMTGGGLVGYFIEDRTVVNLDGLINSLEYFEAMQDGTARDFLDALPLNYAYGNSYIMLNADPYGQFLRGRLIKIGVIRGNDDFILYRYEPNQ